VTPHTLENNLHNQMLSQLQIKKRKKKESKRKRRQGKE
jgi:hypothetical protein